MHGLRFSVSLESEEKPGREMNNQLQSQSDATDIFIGIDVGTAGAAAACGGGR